MSYFSEFFETDIINPYTCDTERIRYHGIIYTYRKTWFTKRIKKKVIYHTSKSYNIYSLQIENVKKEVQSEIDKLLTLLKK